MNRRKHTNTSTTTYSSHSKSLFEDTRKKKTIELKKAEFKHTFISTNRMIDALIQILDDVTTSIYIYIHK